MEGGGGGRARGGGVMSEPSFSALIDRFDHTELNCPFGFLSFATCFFFEYSGENILFFDSEVD